MKPTVAEIRAIRRTSPSASRTHDPDYPVYSYQEILDCAEPVPELEPLHRLAMVLHNQYPWELAETQLVEVGKIGDDDFVVAFVPRNHEVLEFIRRVKAGHPGRPRPDTPCRGAWSRTSRSCPSSSASSSRSCPASSRSRSSRASTFARTRTSIRNAAYSWSPMTADEIQQKTGIRSGATRSAASSTSRCRRPGRRSRAPGAGRRRSGPIDLLLVHEHEADPVRRHLALRAARDLPDARLVRPRRRLRGLPLRPGLRRCASSRRSSAPCCVVCAEKFSDKIGSVRPSRMIFGDGASALVVGPAAAGAPPDIEVVQMYASGPVSQVNSIIWPNPEFDNNITVYGPEVKALVERYLGQMMGELRALPDPDGSPGSLLDAIDIVVPHQANKTMVATMASRGRPLGRWPLLQCRAGGERLRRQHPARDLRRRPGGRDRPADARVHAGVRGRRGRRLHRHPRRSRRSSFPSGAELTELMTVPEGNVAPSMEDVRAAFGG